MYLLGEVFQSIVNIITKQTNLFKKQNQTIKTNERKDPRPVV